MQLIITIECKPENVNRIKRVAALMNNPGEWDGEFPIENMEFKTVGSLDDVLAQANEK